MFNPLTSLSPIIGNAQSFASNVGNAVGGAWNSIFGGGNSNKSGGGGGGGGWGTPPKTKTTPSSSSNSNYLAELQAQIRALSAPVAPVLRLPNFDILGNYNRAKQTATDAVTPLYNKKLNLFLEGQGIKKTQKTQERDLTLENNAIEEQNTLQDNTTSRVRTGEDLAGVLAQIARGQDEFLTDEGTAFDEARRGLQEEVAGAGGTDTGLGQQEIDKQLRDRNTSSDRQVTQFAEQKAAKQMLASRSFEDLLTGDVRAGQKKGQADKATAIDFDNYMASLANEEQSFRLDNDLAAALDIARQTESNTKQGIQQFIASLAGRGYSAAEIAQAASVYNR